MNLQKYQEGATLVIVLIFLIILTILGVSSMSGSIIQQKSSTNVYLESESFNAAESSIGAIIASHNAGGNFSLPIVKLTDPTAAPYFCVDKTGDVSEKTGDTCTGGLDGNSGVVAQAKAEYLDCPDLCSGFGINSPIKCNYWKLTGEATVGGQTSTTVEQIVSQVGACPSASLPDFN